MLLGFGGVLIQQPYLRHRAALIGTYKEGDRLSLGKFLAGDTVVFSELQVAVEGIEQGDAVARGRGVLRGNLDCAILIGRGEYKLIAAAAHLAEHIGDIDAFLVARFGILHCLVAVIKGGHFAAVGAIELDSVDRLAAVGHHLQLHCGAAVHLLTAVGKLVAAAVQRYCRAAALRLYIAADGLVVLHDDRHRVIAAIRKIGDFHVELVRACGTENRHRLVEDLHLVA